MIIDAYDFDGVVTEGKIPTENDVIITGRCYSEREHVYGYLKVNEIVVRSIYFYPGDKLERGADDTLQSWVRSGFHKGRTVKGLIDKGTEIRTFYEDNPIQLEIIRNIVPDMYYKMMLIPSKEKVS